MTSVDSLNGDVVITWVVPASNGATITDYIVEFYSVTDSNWINTVTQCTSAANSQVMSTQTCQVPMAVFIDDLGLTFNQLI